MSDNLAERVACIIVRHALIPPGSRIGVGVSGGADSVVLLHILNSLSNTLDFEPVVLHVNHQLRGAESHDDEEFVRTLANSLNREVAIERIGIRIEQGNLEEMTRIVRRDFFRRSIEQKSLACVALGHTRSDQAETVLFRFLRGTGLAGLAGMRIATPDRLIRPLLTTSREEIRQWGEQQGFRWRDDSSNQNLAFTRNRLRHETIPTLTQSLNSNLEAVLAGAADLAQAEEDYWHEQIEPLYQQLRQRSRWGPIFDVPALTALHIAVERRIVRRALSEVRGDLRSIDLSHVEAILRICGSEHGHDRVIVPGADALRSFDKLLISAAGAREGERHYRVNVAVGDDCTLPFGAGSVSLRLDAPNDAICDSFKEDPGTIEFAELDADALAGRARASLFVRNWEPGDRLDRSGHDKPEKIKSLFQEYRVPLWERRHWPILMFGDEIVWARRFGTAAKYRKSAESHGTLRLIYWDDVTQSSHPGVLNRKSPNLRLSL